MPKYQIQLGLEPVGGGVRVPCAILKDDYWSIPMNPDNADYQQYLKWVAEGNTPEPADSE
jgi:hypothetical protein